MKFFKIFLISYVSFIVIFTVIWLLLYPPIQLGGNTGYFVIATTSMMPTLYPGDLVLTKPVSAYHVGDIIAFVSPQHIVVVHRIIEALGNGCYRTKGDANPSPDPWIVCKNMIIGKVVLRIPLLGSLIEEARRSPIVMIMVVIITSLIIVSPIAVAYSLSNRKNNEATGRTIVKNRYRTSKRDEKLLLIIGIVFSCICILVIASMVYTAMSLRYVVRSIRVPIVTVSGGAYYTVLLKNNMLYNTTILKNPSFTYTKIVKSIIIRPYVRIVYDKKYVESLLKNCTLSIVLTQDRTYGWRRTLGEGIPCEKPITISYSYLKKLIDDINREVNMYSTKYSVELLYSIDIEYSLANGTTGHNIIYKKCEINLNYIFNVISFEKCNYEYTIYDSISKLVPRKIRTPFGYLDIKKFITIMLGLLSVPIMSMSVMLYFYSRKRKDVEDPLKEVLERYGDIIIRTNERPKVSSKEIVKIASIEDLIKLSKIISKPVFYTALSSSKGKVHLFYIESNNKLFVYVIMT
ncbi:MAG: signal peptidase I [Crenarchaeota archaeon]|nr:signal peptidase I [Thermoproteota archaeon]